MPLTKCISLRRARAPLATGEARIALMRQPKMFKPSQLFAATAHGEEFGFAGPLADFNTGEDFIFGQTFPPVNGLVQSVSISDYPFGTPVVTPP